MSMCLQIHGYCLRIKVIRVNEKAESDGFRFFVFSLAESVYKCHPERSENYFTIFNSDMMVRDKASTIELFT